MISSIKSHIKRILKPTSLDLYTRISPISKEFGFDRGTPIDRFYIDKFLAQNSELITGTVLEIAESTYSKKFGKNISKIEILHSTMGNEKATIIGDLCNTSTLPQNSIDCFICTQTLNFIYDFNSAIKGAYFLLKPGGVFLGTVAGICPISLYDMERWGDYWRFTSLAFKNALSSVFNPALIEVDSFGNLASCKAFLDGLSAEELSKEVLNYKDAKYELLVTVIARK